MPRMLSKKSAQFLKKKAELISGNKKHLPLLKQSAPNILNPGFNNIYASNITPEEAITRAINSEPLSHNLNNSPYGYINYPNLYPSQQIIPNQSSSFYEPGSPLDIPFDYSIQEQQKVEKNKNQLKESLVKLLNYLKQLPTRVLNSRQEIIPEPPQDRVPENVNAVNKPLENTPVAPPAFSWENPENSFNSNNLFDYPIQDQANILNQPLPPELLQNIPQQIQPEEAETPFYRGDNVGLQAILNDPKVRQKLEDVTLQERLGLLPEPERVRYNKLRGIPMPERESRADRLRRAIINNAYNEAFRRKYLEEGITNALNSVLPQLEEAGGLLNSYAVDALGDIYAREAWRNRPSGVANNPKMSEVLKQHFKDDLTKQVLQKDLGVSDDHPIIRNFNRRQVLMNLLANTHESDPRRTEWQQELYNRNQMLNDALIKTYATAFDVDGNTVYSMPDFFVPYDTGELPATTVATLPSSQIQYPGDVYYEQADKQINRAKFQQQLASGEVARRLQEAAKKNVLAPLPQKRPISAESLGRMYPTQLQQRQQSINNLINELFNTDFITEAAPQSNLQQNVQAPQTWQKVEQGPTLIPPNVQEPQAWQNAEQGPILISPNGQQIPQQGAKLPPNVQGPALIPPNGQTTQIQPSQLQESQRAQALEYLLPLRKQPNAQTQPLTLDQLFPVLTPSKRSGPAFELLNQPTQQVSAANQQNRTNSAGPLPSAPARTVSQMASNGRRNFGLFNFNLPPAAAAVPGGVLANARNVGGNFLPKNIMQPKIRRTGENAAV